MSKKLVCVTDKHNPKLPHDIGKYMAIDRCVSQAASWTLNAATKQRALLTFAPTPTHSEMFAAPVIVAREPTCKQVVLHLHE